MTSRFMGNEKLQALSQQYARGEIAKLEYRQKRTEIIDEATGASLQETATSIELTQTPVYSNLPNPSTVYSSTVYLRVGIISVVIIGALILVFTVM